MREKDCVQKEDKKIKCTIWENDRKAVFDIRLSIEKKSEDEGTAQPKSIIQIGLKQLKIKKKTEKK